MDDKINIFLVTTVKCDIGSEHQIIKDVNHRFYFLWIFIGIF